MFAGYKKYQRLSMRQFLQRFLPAPARTIVAMGARSLLSPKNRIRHAVSAHAGDVSQMLLDMLTTCFPMATLRAAAHGDLVQTLKHYSPMEVVQPLLAKVRPRDVGLVNAMRYLDLKLTLAGDMLVKVDRASMAVSLEVRPVYLHRDVMALAGRVPPNLLVDRKQSKKALKAALRPWLPNSILYRNKMGFGIPLNKWMNRELSDLFTPGNDRAHLTDLFDASLAETITREHASDASRLASATHSTTLLSSWLSKWAGDTTSLKCSVESRVVRTQPLSLRRTPV
jgi:asparagine synthase (glutamine-hydrolysing)